MNSDTLMFCEEAVDLNDGIAKEGIKPISVEINENFKKMGPYPAPRPVR
ncbi:MAG: hypothetical protein JW944_06830 [Deltaproteobacteria bacterium]|nr:hypothetical protein [Deltaproteobacteria bacterium]